MWGDESHKISSRLTRRLKSWCIDKSWEYFTRMWSTEMLLKERREQYRENYLLLKGESVDDNSDALDDGVSGV